MFLFLCHWKWCGFFKRQLPPIFFFYLWICNIQANLKWLVVDPHAFRDATENCFLWTYFRFAEVRAGHSEATPSFDALPSVEHVPWQPVEYLSHPELHVIFGGQTLLPESSSIILSCHLRWRWQQPDSWMVIVRGQQGRESFLKVCIETHAVIHRLGWVSPRKATWRLSLDWALSIQVV